MDLIFDTHAIFWLATDHPNLSPRVVERLLDADTRSFVSAVTIWEYGDLLARGRLTDSAPFSALQESFAFEPLDFPATACAHAATLPKIHRDPIDRMLVAHAIAADLTIVTADRRIAEYPVPTLW